jgi:hypothetical protein
MKLFRRKTPTEREQAVARVAVIEAEIVRCLQRIDDLQAAVPPVSVTTAKGEGKYTVSREDQKAMYAHHCNGLSAERVWLLERLHRGDI